MSITSKARRDARKRKLAKARNAPTVAAAPIEPHADLRDEHGQLLGGIVRRDDEWVLGMGGKIAGGSDSAARVLAMLKRAAALHESQGTAVRLNVSTMLGDAAQREVSEQGLSFEQFEARLAQEMASGNAPPLHRVDADNEVRH
ncbi:hypothetical protein ACFQZQ_01675 [Lysobacter koreensis]|uniref:Uncharacterized protein n=1 Tax=Lysobacter koreensis TaxID=266122 RepID=A0ABW2YJ62_9GAMM